MNNYITHFTGRLPTTIFPEVGSTNFKGLSLFLLRGSYASPPLVILSYFTEFLNKSTIAMNLKFFDFQFLSIFYVF